ncbi:MAG TPA: heme biosynthesis HemY N-terminal domain-containing protein, partial [Methylotenera sp.]|nr:heme biosynthesis HemY N-terminal domain-containing protein [Methylotenera sp.]
AAILGIMIMQQPGFANFSHGDISIEIKLIDFFLLVAIGLPVLYGLVRLLVNLFHLPARLMNSATKKRQQAALHAMEDALGHEAKLEIEKAIGCIRKNIQSSPAPVLQHALAAKITEHAGKKQLRDEHISALQKLAWPAAEMFELNALLDAGRIEKVVSLISQKPNLSTGDKVALAQAFQHLDQLENLDTQLLHLQKLDDVCQEVSDTFDSGLNYLVQRYSAESDADALSSLWGKYSKAIEAKPALLRQYVRALRVNQLDSKAEQIIFTALSSNWCDQLVREYGLLNLGNTEHRIQQVEDWLKKHNDSAGLHLTLGRLCKQAKLWGKAKDYLNSSLSRRPLSEAYAELAEIHEVLNENEDAYRCAKKGIHLANQHVH